MKDRLDPSDERSKESLNDLYCTRVALLLSMVASMKSQTAAAPPAAPSEPCYKESATSSIDSPCRCEDSVPYGEDSVGQASECPEVEKTALHQNLCGSLSRNLERSMSHDRKMAESAQFFQAVGESPKGGQDIEIVDTAGEDSIDDEDQGAEEIPGRTIIRNRLHTELRGGMLRRWSVPFRMLPSKPWVEETSPVREDLNYRGIGEAGMEITRCGLQRGNCVTLHRKAWLEVSDLRHRYGKNLRIYYRHWGSLGCPTNNFFHWLDSTGEAEGMPLPDLAECPRKQLDSDTVLYITDAKITQSYALSVVTSASDRRAIVLDSDGEPVKTGPEGWIFVLRDHVLYGSRKVTAVTAHSKQRFHHSSFFGGKAVSAAGIIVTDDEGYLTEVHPHSGHYRPGEPDIQRCLFHLYSKGVCLDTFEVDMQQIFHVSRQKEPAAEAAGNKKKQKKSCLYLKPASYAACFLSHKAKAGEEGVFHQIKRGSFALRSLSEEDAETSSSGSRFGEGSQSFMRSVE